MPAPKKQRWSQRVTQESRALELEPGVFTFPTPRKVALSLRRSAEVSRSRKTDAFRSAMSMLNFFINRAGKQLPAARRARLEAAKDELRALYGRKRQGAPALTRGKARSGPRRRS